MKFRGARSERGRRSRSVDVIGSPEDTTRLDFDPRRDFPPEELALLKRLAGTEHEKITLPNDTVANGWWLKFVDEEFAQEVKRQPGLKQDLEHEFTDYVGNREPTRLKDGKWVQWCVPLVQLFPELRSVIRQKFIDARLPDVLKAGGSTTDPTDLFDVTVKLLPLVQLYPERRTEFLELSGIHPNEVVGLVAEAVNSRGKLFSKNKLLVASRMMLLFPQFRSEILSILPPDKTRWIALFKEARQPFDHSDYEFGFDLSVLSAQDARINSSGEIELELNPHTLGKDSTELPTRSLL